MIIDNQLTNSVPDSEHGTTLSMSMAANALIRTGSPLLAGLMLDKLGFSSFGVVGVIFSCLSLAMIVKITPFLKAKSTDKKDA